jgi:hypothetical protein
MRYIEEVIPFIVATGDATKAIQFSTPADGTTVVGAVIYHNGLDKNPEMINVEIQAGGHQVSKLQHIDNYRSREASYPTGYKPVDEFQSGKTARLTITADAAFTADFKGQLILIKSFVCNG